MGESQAILSGERCSRKKNGSFSKKENGQRRTKRLEGGTNDSSKYVHNFKYL